MNYRRAFIPGGSYFFTLVTENRRSIFAARANVDVLRDAFRAVKAKRPFSLDAIVVMPDASGRCRLMMPISQHAGGS